MADHTSSNSAYPRVDLSVGSGATFPEMERRVLDAWAAADDLPREYRKPFRRS